jgi:hypothetical protein
MDDNSAALVMAVIALSMVVLMSKRLDRLARDVDCLVDGDTETVKLRRKLDGYPGSSDDG